MITIREYIDPHGRSPCAKWFNRLNGAAAAKVVTALIRMEQGNFSTFKGIGEGVFECRIDFGPGYRIYFGKDGDAVVILLGGAPKNAGRKI
jgi:putative addiction module killer protein